MSRLSPVQPKRREAHGTPSALVRKDSEPESRHSTQVHGDELSLIGRTPGAEVEFLNEALAVGVRIPGQVLGTDFLSAHKLTLLGFECATREVPRLVEDEQNRFRPVASAADPSRCSLSGVTVEEMIDRMFGVCRGKVHSPQARRSISSSTPPESFGDSLISSFRKTADRSLLMGIHPVVPAGGSRRSYPQCAPLSGDSPCGNAPTAISLKCNPEDADAARWYATRRLRRLKRRSDPGRCAAPRPQLLLTPHLGQRELGGRCDHFQNRMKRCGGHSQLVHLFPCTNARVRGIFSQVLLRVSPALRRRAFERLKRTTLTVVQSDFISTGHRTLAFGRVHVDRRADERILRAGVKRPRASHWRTSPGIEPAPGAKHREHDSFNSEAGRHPNAPCPELR